ncbi:MAG: MFS transporter [Micromonosporaceae bacterium]
MGFFTGAYDLFIIGVVVSLLKPEWRLSTSQVSLLRLCHAGILGLRCAPVLQDRRNPRAQADLRLRNSHPAGGCHRLGLSPNYAFLVISRVVLGIGTGGDYPVSATIMSEYAAKRSRGRMVGLVFAMQGAASS